MVKESHIDVEPEHLTLVKKILKRHITYKTVWAYGSRVNWTANQYSDLDLVVFDANTVKLGELKEDFAECDLPFSVDIVLWEKIPENFKNKILEKYVALQKKPELEGWKECRLGDVASKIGSGATPRGGSNVYKDFGVSLIRSQNVLDFEFSRYGLVFIDDSQANELKNVEIQENDVLLNITGDSVARCCIVPNNILPARVNQHVSIIRLNPELADYKLVFYSLQYLKDELLMQAEIGATRKALTKGMVENLEIFLPSLSEQKAIASVLSSLDDKIDLLHRQNKTLEAMAETLFRQWFVEEAQEDWVTVRIGDFVKTNISSITKDTSLMIIRYLDTGSLTEGKIDSFQNLDMNDAPSRARRIVKHNDVLISTVRPNQKHYGIMKHPDEDIIVSTGFCVITCEKINPHFIYVLLTTDEMTGYLHSIAEGSTSTYPSLKPSDIEALEFKLPPEGKLRDFSEYADNAWNKIDYNHAQMCILEKLRDTLLPKLMSGEVRVEMEMCNV